MTLICQKCGKKIPATRKSIIRVTTGFYPQDIIYCSEKCYEAEWKWVWCPACGVERHVSLETNECSVCGNNINEPFDEYEQEDDE